jgi:periplasmic divalent cation tolerance protein
MKDFIVVLITCPSPEEAENLSKKILSERLAACVNIINSVHSLFHWQGKIEDDQESLMIVKTRSVLLDQLKTFVQENHPYDVPEVIALPIVGGSDDYMEWMKSETTV